MISQMEALQEKYAELEKEYVTARADAKQKMTEFLETDAGVKLSDYDQQLKSFRECITKKQPVRSFRLFKAYI